LNKKKLLVPIRTLENSCPILEAHAWNIPARRGEHPRAKIVQGENTVYQGEFKGTRGKKLVIFIYAVTTLSNKIVQHQNGCP